MASFSHSPAAGLGTLIGRAALIPSLILLVQSSAATPAAGLDSLTGVVRSPREGAMEGVVVSAKRQGSTITVSVVTDSRGRFGFPADRLRPGHYVVSIRAVGYDLAAPVAADVATGRVATVDLNLADTADLAGQLSNAEWLISAPGSDEDKSALLSCNECHTLERPLASSHDPEEFVGVMQRMAGYAFNSFVGLPQRLEQPRIPEPARYERVAKYLASINRSQGGRLSYPLKTLPRVTGKGTRVIITEYDLPRPLTQPHDVILDRQGIAWYTDFGQQFIGRLDPVTGEVREFAIPLVRPNSPRGSLAIEIGSDGALWIAMLYQGAIGRFDPRTEKWRIYPLPQDMQRPDVRLSHLSPTHLGVDGKVWTAGANGPMRLDPKTGAFEVIHSSTGSPPALHAFALITGWPTSNAPGLGVNWTDYYNQRLADAKSVQTGPLPRFSEVPVMYGLTSDARNNLYALDFGGERVVRIDAKTRRITNYRTTAFASRPRRGRTDAQDRVWFAQYNVNRIGMIDPRTGLMREWTMPTPWTSPYDVVGDRNGFAWTAGMDTDRVVRLAVKTGELVEFPLPRSTNVRRVFVDDRTKRSIFWTGNNHSNSIIRVEPM